MRALKYIIALAGLFLAFACTIDNVDSVRVDGANDGSKITICGKITRFTDCHVGTRANKTSEEAYVSEMVFAMFPVNQDGTLGNCVNYEVREGSNLLFTLDRSQIPTGYANKEFAMYIFTNMPNLPDDGFTGKLDSLLNCRLANPGISRPEDGFPMIGSLGDPNRDGNRFVLMPMNGNRMELPTVNTTPTDYLNIPMYAVFAKMSFTVYVTPDQNIMTNKASMFEMTGYEIHNLPTVVSFDQGDNNKEVEQAVNQDPLVHEMSDIAMGGLDGGDLIEFDFYLPERYVTPNTSADEYEYPFGKGSGISPEDEKYRQRYKPCLLGEGQKATFIRIKGKFRDHQEHYYDVSYDIYLGTDEYSNFDIIRNYEYINMVNIKGITSSKDQTTNDDGIAIDHRVTINRSTPLVINFRRETLLDAHYEVRPMRLRLVGDSIPNGTSATVEVLDKNGTTDSLPSWIRLEKSGNTEDHITSGVSAGKRKYFTTNLVTTELAEVGKSVTVGNLTGDNQAVWVYVDENTDTKSRAAIVRVSYGGVDKDYKIVQQGLFEVTVEDSGRTYYIEQYEEYLYNYDAEDSYGQTKQEGMQWGLDGVQLSNEHYSFNNVSLTPNVDWEKYDTKGPRPYYDFYTWHQDSVVLMKAGIAKSDDRSHDIDYAGQHFTQEIFDATKNNSDVNKKVNVLTMADQPKGAVEYCYNRNKRDANGNVEKVEWYLPSADELEEFIVPAYGTFKEFQDNYYWTSQPAYIRNVFYYEYQGSWGGRKSISAPIVYDDNTAYARATKVRKDGSFVPVKSGLKEEPTPSVNRTPSDDYTNVGYFDKMHYYKRYYEGFLGTRLTEVYGPDKLADENRTGDEQYSHNNEKYFFHLNIPVEYLIEKTDGEHGYHLRTKHNRVRCVRKMN